MTKTLKSKKKPRRISFIITTSSTCLEASSISKTPLKSPVCRSSDRKCLTFLDGCDLNLIDSNTGQSPKRRLELDEGMTISMDPKANKGININNDDDDDSKDALSLKHIQSRVASGPSLDFDEKPIEMSTELIESVESDSQHKGNGVRSLLPTQVSPSQGETTMLTELEAADTDSAIGSSMTDEDTASLSSSVIAYRYENGRRYHAYKEGKWIMPNDEIEQDRMDFYHHIFILRLDGELFLAPIVHNPQKILDIGTGTGIWAIDMADKFPSAEVVGIDLSPIQPSWVPPNCRFEIDDCEEEWTHPKNAFDLIHIRNLAGGIGDWRALFRRCYDHCKPGGYLEVQEVPSLFLTDDDSLPAYGGMNRMLSCFYAASKKADLCFTNMDKLAGWMEEAGFIVEQKIYRMPIGIWPQEKKLKEIGKYMLANLLSSLESYCLALFTRQLQMTPAECKKVLDAAAKEAMRKDIHMYLPVYFIWGKKPETV